MFIGREVIITAEILEESLRLLAPQKPPKLPKGAPAPEGAKVAHRGSLVTDSPLSLAIAAELPGAIVAMDGDSISISHKGRRDLLAVPAGYQGFDREFCAAVHAMRGKNGSAKPTPARKAALLAMLPLTVFVGEVYVRPKAVLAAPEPVKKKPRRHNLPAGIPAREVASFSL